MKYISLDFFQDFKCVGGACPDTCCAGWSISVDPQSASEYRAVPGEFGQKLRENLFEKEDTIFFLNPDIEQRCPFLTDENLCEIYQKLGKEKMCETCKDYPRICCIYGGIRPLLSLTISCPEVARIMLERRDPIKFRTCEVEERPQPEAGTDWNFFNILMSALTVSLDLLRDRTMPLSLRLRLLLLFTSTLQTQIDEGEDTSSTLADFSSPENYQQYAEFLATVPENLQMKLHAFFIFCRNYQKFLNYKRLRDLVTADCIREEAIIETFRYFKNETWDIQYENYCIYYLFRNYLNALKTKAPMSIVADLLLMLNLHTCLGVLNFDREAGELPFAKQVDIFCTLSRAFEHSPKSLDDLYHIYLEEGQDTLDLNFLNSII